MLLHNSRLDQEVLGEAVPAASQQYWLTDQMKRIEAHVKIQPQEHLRQFEPHHFHRILESISLCN